ncbi:MAG: diacylglycerol O-acyltransferase [Oceanicoccus sp.]|jgi:diacylglycerol O-acyltransferase
MQKLGALDANFLYLESEKAPNHISSVQIFELPKNQGPDEFLTGLKSYYLERLHLVPYLTRKLKFTPGNIDHPVWVEDPDFDVNNHFTQVELPKPGTFGQLEEKVAEIHSVLMDRNKPLWRIFLITGLEDGKIAYYNQAHHACMDGMAAQATTMTLMDTTPCGPEIPSPIENRQPDESLAEVLRLSFENLLKFQITAPSQTLKAMDSIFRVAKRAIDPRMPLGDLFRLAPKTRFNRSVKKERTYAAGNMSVFEMKAMAKLTDCKLNDIFLAICAGGLRRYMLRTGELPTNSLVAACPVSLRTPDDKSIDNKVTMMGVSLASDIADARLRLNTIVDSSRIAKEIVAETAGLQDPEISLYGFPAAISAFSRLAETFGLADVLRSPMNVLISNVPGPRKTLYSNGAKMLTHYPVSIPAHGMGLNITGTSYVDSFCFAITSCAKAVPDATIMRDDIMDAYEELKSVVLPVANTVENLPTQRKSADRRELPLPASNSVAQEEAKVA